MINFLEVFLLVIILGLSVWVYKLYQDKKENENEVAGLSKEKDEAESFAGGLEEYNKKVQEKKEQAKAKILEIFKNKDKISNKDVVSLLCISTATAVRYLDELEKEGKVKQVGKAGKYVFYSRV